jgi:hypothetical protein
MASRGDVNIVVQSLRHTNAADPSLSWCRLSPSTAILMYPTLFSRELCNLNRIPKCTYTSGGSASV